MTWEPYSNLDSVPLLVRAFEKTQSRRLFNSLFYKSKTDKPM